MICGLVVAESGVAGRVVAVPPPGAGKVCGVVRSVAAMVSVAVFCVPGEVSCADTTRLTWGVVVRSTLNRRPLCAEAAPICRLVV